MSLSAAHHQTGKGGQHTFSGSSRCSSAGSCCPARFQKPLNTSGEIHEQWEKNSILLKFTKKQIHWFSSFLTQILHQERFVVFFLQSRHAVVHHQLRLLRQIYSHFGLDSAKQERLQDSLQLSSWKQKHSMKDAVFDLMSNYQVSAWHTASLCN